MYTRELYDRTVDILFQAYFNDTLEHGDCRFCAVGNLCFAAGFPRADGLLTNDGLNAGAWGLIFKTMYNQQHLSAEQVRRNHGSEVIKNARTVIKATGYKWKDLAKIEYAFETAPKGNNDDDWMFNGLVAVLDVLKEIHGIDDDSENKQRFTKHYQLKTA